MSSTLTGFALAVEIGDWQRFTGAGIGAYLGLVPTEYSRGQSRRQGGSPRPATATPAGCWSRLPGTTSPATPSAGSSKPAGTRPPRPRGVRGHIGNQRLHHRWVSFTARKKKHTVATTAIARELAGWCWSLATLPD